MKTTKVSSGKVLLSHFKNQKLALFAKCCARVAACIDNMCPEDKLACWPTFKEELDCLENKVRAKEFQDSLDEINDNPDTRDQLLRFVSN